MGCYDPVYRITTHNKVSNIYIYILCICLYIYIYRYVFIIYLYLHTLHMCISIYIYIHIIYIYIYYVYVAPPLGFRSFNLLGVPSQVVGTAIEQFPGPRDSASHSKCRIGTLRTSSPRKNINSYTSHPPEKYVCSGPYIR